MKFGVPEMSCGHCTAAIEKGIKAKDPSAVVTTDLDQRMVTIQTSLPESEIKTAIVDAGYEASAA